MAHKFLPPRVREVFSALVATCLAGGICISLVPHPASATPVTSVANPQAVQMSDLSAYAVATLQSERATAPASNTSSNFPSATNLALQSLDFRASPNIVRVNMGPPLAAIANFLVTGSQAEKDSAINDINILLGSQEQPNGALFVRPSAADIDTMFFADHLGLAVIALGSNLDNRDRAAWSEAVEGAADYLVADGNLRWYTNGNIVVGNALTMALAWKLSGLQKYFDYYQQALDFAVSPPQTRWPGYGFVTSQEPSAPDGSDGAGYFTEAGASPGYDGDYAQLQSEQLSRLYLVTRDPQVLRLLNMVTNKLLSLTNTLTWMLNSSNGTRHNYPAEPMDTSAIATLAYQGGRTDLMRLVPSQVNATVAEFRGCLQTQLPLGDRVYYALGMIPLSIVMATSSSASQVSSFPVPSSPTGSPTPTVPGTSVSSTSSPGGAPTLSVRTPQVVTVSIAAPTTVLSGRTIRIRGRVIGVRSGDPLANVHVDLYAHNAVRKGSFRIGSAVSKPSGLISASVNANVNTAYLWVVPNTAGVTWARSASIEVIVKPWVSLHRAKPKNRKTVRLWGRSSLGTANYVYLQQLTSGTWRTISRRIPLKAVRGSSHPSAIFSVIVKLKRRGTISYRAYRPSSSTNPAGTSTTITISFI